ncbi:MAG: tetratricopeptide repeat protein [Pirellulaceae bacterium]
MLSQLPVAPEEVSPEIHALLRKAVTGVYEGDEAAVNEVSDTLLSMITNAGVSDEDLYDDGEAFVDDGLSNPDSLQVLMEMDEDADEDEALAIAKRALELDEHSVEAMVLAGDVCDNEEEAASWYLRASEAAKHHDPVLVAQLMPPIRRHMGSQLISEGRISDAAQVLLPGLDEDPSDIEELRFLIVSVTLRLGWHDELKEVLDCYEDDRDGVLEYARALHAFQQDGPSDEANRLLKIADEMHPEMADYLAGRRRIPDEHIGFPDELTDAILSTEYLLPGIREIEGAARWIRESTVAGKSDLHGFNDDIWESGDPLDIACDLDAEPIQWHVSIEKHSRDNVYLGIVLEDDQLVFAQLFEGDRPGTRALRDFVTQAIASPMYGRQRKPETVCVATKADVKALAKHCGSYGVAVVQGKSASASKKHTQQMIDTMCNELLKLAADESHTDDDWESVDDLYDLPRSDEPRIFAVLRPPLWIHDGPSPRRSWIQIAIDTENGFILKMNFTNEPPTIKQMLGTMKAAMLSPSMGDAVFAQNWLLDGSVNEVPLSANDANCDIVTALSEQLPDTEIEFGESNAEHCVNVLMAELLSRSGPTDSAIATQDGIEDQDMHRFYEVTANFYRAKPWMMVGGDQMFDVTCSAWENPKRTACVMGQLGQELGIAVYDDPQVARAMLETMNPQMDFDAIVVHYGEVFETISVDCWYHERKGWPLASEEAYPFVARVAGGRKMMTATPEDIHVLTQLLPHVPRFLDHPRDQPFHVSSGNDKIVFQWCDE